MKLAPWLLLKCRSVDNEECVTRIVNRRREEVVGGYSSQMKHTWNLRRSHSITNSSRTSTICSPTIRTNRAMRSFREKRRNWTNLRKNHGDRDTTQQIPFRSRVGHIEFCYKTDWIITRGNYGYALAKQEKQPVVACRECVGITFVLWSINNATTSYTCFSKSPQLRMKTLPAIRSTICTIYTFKTKTLSY